MMTIARVVSARMKRDRHAPMVRCFLHAWVGDAGQRPGLRNADAARLVAIHSGGAETAALGRRLCRRPGWLQQRPDEFRWRNRTADRVYAARNGAGEHTASLRMERAGQGPSLGRDLRRLCWI